MTERIRKPVKPKPASRCWPGLRHAVASSEWTIDSGLTKNAAYAGPYLLVIAHGTRHMSSPGWADPPGGKGSQDAADSIAAIAFPAEEHGSLTCIVADV